MVAVFRSMAKGLTISVPLDKIGKHPFPLVDITAACSNGFRFKVSGSMARERPDLAALRSCRCFALTHSRDRYFFSVDLRAPRTCGKRIFRIGGDGKVHRGVYLRLYNSCTNLYPRGVDGLGSAPPSNRGRTAVFISRENSVLGSKKID